jgi:NADPH-dependent 2,4-dienoyl-CoA reductase/sulfur reductase-like enzyme
MAWDFFIIGADAAGLSAAVQIKRLRPQASIRIVNKGRFISYAACGIPYVISGEITPFQKLIHFTPETFEKARGIAVEIRKEAVDINPKEHSVDIRNLETGETQREQYQRLLIATGAAPRPLPFLDYGEDGIFNVHTIEDLTRIIDFLERRKPARAAVVGAGNVGLEVAEALTARGIKVHLFEVFPEPAMTWPPLVRKAVLRKIEEKGIDFYPGTPVKKVSRSGHSFLLETAAAEIQADAIFSVAGTAPATEFCRGRLDLEKNGAIRANQRGRTSDPDIYAAGDCATVYHRVLGRDVYFPLGSTANKMGRIAGINMAGGDTAFPGIVGTQILKFFELSVARTGLSLEDSEQAGIRARVYSAKRLDKASYFPGASPAEVEVVLGGETGKIIGAAAVVEGNAAQFIDPAAMAVFSGMNVADLGWFDSAYAPPFAPVWNALISAALKATQTE